MSEKHIEHLSLEKLEGLLFKKRRIRRNIKKEIMQIRRVLNRKKQSIPKVDKIIQKQAIQVSIKELIDLSYDLNKQRLDFNNHIPVSPISLTKKWSVNIINKSTASDTWEFEK